MVGTKVNTLDVFLWNCEQTTETESMWDAECLKCKTVVTVSFNDLKAGTAHCPDCGIVAEKVETSST